jgi:thiol:disulfide interchange protein DsbD
MRKILSMAWLALLLVAPLGAMAQGFSSLGYGEPEFLEAHDVFKVDSVVIADGAVRVRATIAPGYYVYRHRLALEADGAQVPLALPHGKLKSDEFFGTTEVYRDGIEFEIRGASATTATLHWQGCADAGICYPPQTLQLALPAVPASAAAAPPPAQPATRMPDVGSPPDTQIVAAATPEVGPDATELPAATGMQAPAPGIDASRSGAPSGAPAAAGTTALAEDEAFAQRLAGSGLAMAALVFFGLGLLLAFTPCTLPMIPIVSSLVLGGRPSPSRALVLSAAYVLPMALTYAALGVAAGLSGANLQAALQNPWLLGGFAALFVVLALAMFGAFELQLPAWLRDRLGRASRGREGGTLAGAAAMGFLSALLVGPCMTAPLAGALLYISQSGDPTTGGVALFALGLGMGLPLLLIAVFGARVLPKPGPWMDRVKAMFGFVMLALAVSMLARVVPAPVSLALWGAWLLAVAAGLMALAAQDGTSPLWRWGPRGVAAIAAVWAVAMMFGGASGASDPWRPLQALEVAPAVAAATTGPAYIQVKSKEDVARRLAEAGARGQWTLVDFYADWCVSCHVIEREVFGDPEVAAALARMQVLRPDVTANDAVDQTLMHEWQVVGPPTLLLIGPDGRERRALRTIGEIPAARFLVRLERARAEGGA